MKNNLYWAPPTCERQDQRSRKKTVREHILRERRKGWGVGNGLKNRKREVKLKKKKTGRPGGSITNELLEQK